MCYRDFVFTSLNVRRLKKLSQFLAYTHAFEYIFSYGNTEMKDRNKNAKKAVELRAFVFLLSFRSIMTAATITIHVKAERRKNENAKSETTGTGVGCS